jgi:hypothetical protein
VDRAVEAITRERGLRTLAFAAVEGGRVMRAWPGAWAEFPDHQPPGDAYDLLDYGLVTPPALSAGR